MHFKQKPYTRNFRSASGDLLTGCLPLPERAIWWGAKSFQHRNDLPFSVKRLLLCVWAAVLGRSPCLGAWPCARLPLALVAGWLAGLGGERGWTLPSAPVRSSVGGHCVCLIALLPHTHRQVGDDVRGNPPVSKSRYAQKKTKARSV